jgi:tetratricopeptide (TPR) repeat protein
LGRAGRLDEAIGWYQRAAEAGDYDALDRAVELLGQAGRVDEAIDWLQTLATETRGPRILRLAAELLKQAGRVDEAIDWLQTLATETGNPFALAYAAGLLGGPAASTKLLTGWGAAPWPATATPCGLRRNC